MLNIIGDGATNHFGSLALGKKLIDAAVDAGLDILKLQLIDNNEVYLPGDYEYGPYKIADIRRSRQEAFLKEDEFRTLQIYANSKGIGLSATPFGIDTANFLKSCNPPYIKVASGDMNNTFLLSNLVTLDTKLVISIGMASFDDVEKLVAFLFKCSFSNYVLMHCISIYPHEEEESQLGYIKKLQESFGCEVGFSDHTIGHAAACAAIALGVTWLEKHFTLSRNLGGLDAKQSLEPAEMKEYVSTVRAVFSSLSSTDRLLTDKELYTRKRARRGLYAVRNLKSGSIISKDDILCLRPESLLPADSYFDLIGMTLSKDVLKLQPFTKFHIK